MNQTAKEIVRALRCCAAPEGEKTRKCEQCAWYLREKLTPEEQEMLGTDEWCSCDVDQLCLDAAARLERMVEIEESIESLQAESERVKKENAALAAQEVAE